jgi:histidinol-phosphate aminotransferase
MEVGNIKPWVMDIKPYVPGDTREGYVKLASNENDYGPSQRVVKALREKAGLVYRYPYKDESVREKMAGYCGVSKENIIISNGSDELIDLAVKTFRGPSCGVFPSFSEYQIVSNTNGMEYIEVPLNQDFTFPLEEFKRKTERANLIFLCSPNNPLGSILPEDVIKEILDLGKPTVVDEAYYEFYGKTNLKFLPDYKNLIITRTFAKAFGLAGLRAGYAIATPEVINLIYKTKPPFNVNALAQEACLAALDDLGYVQKCVKKIIKDREAMKKKLEENYRVLPSYANFLLVDVSPMTAQDFYQKLYLKKIIVRKIGNLPGFNGEYVRITVGTSKENRKLSDTLDEIGGSK